ncbi:MAG: helix-turn-helix transcriptional regulator [Clostridia bacterium]|nr:helix-turn-helix transcriptional regulator [Clostridia bacterium]MBR5044831.1 helix-turn-helix transcriptional regulator [Clostridia bacterium]
MAEIYSSDKVIESELGLNSCGVQTISDRDWHVKRRRKDFTIMYIAKGKATMIKSRKRIEVGEGEAMFFPPDVDQNYVFLHGDNSINKWVHFGGRFAAPLEAGGARKITIANVKDFENALDGLVRAYNGIGEQRENLKTGYLRVILAHLRESETKIGKESSKYPHRMAEALNYVHINAYTGVDFDYAASICYLSRNRFNHVFKEVTGFSPNVYLTKIRIERAKPLLRDEGMTVRECAESVGFDDANYFCRVFRKETGVSPKKYAGGEG